MDLFKAVGKAIATAIYNKHTAHKQKQVKAIK